MTRIQIDNGYLEILENVALPINLGIADIKDYGSRSGGFTKYIDVEGNENNTFVLGLNFDIDLDSLTFDTNIKRECTIIQNGVPVFEGYIQLINIERLNKFSNTNYKKYKYKIYIFDEVASFFTAVGERELTDLSFPELSHIFNRDTILNSWGATSGYIYPLFPNSDTNIWTLNDFKPAIFEKNYFDKIFSNAGYTYTFEDLDRSDIRFNKRIIPFNGKTSDEEISALLENPFRVNGKKDSFNFELLQTVPQNPILVTGRFNTIEPITFNNNCFDFGLSLIDLDESNQYSIVNETLTSLVGGSINWEFDIEYDYVVELRAKNPAASVLGQFQPTQWRAVFNGNLPPSVVGGSRLDLKLSSIVQDKSLSTGFSSLGDPLILDNDITIFSFDNTTVYGPGFTTFATGTNRSVGVIPEISTNTELITRFLVYGEYFDGSGNAIVPNNFQDVNDLPLFFYNSANERVAVERKVSITNVVLRARPLLDTLTKNAVVNMDAFIPRKIKQIDIIKAVLKTYNLLMIPDPENEKNIIIKTRDDYYDGGEEWDWSSKFIEDLPNTLDFIPEKLSKRFILKYKDDDDIINKAYQDETLKSFGQLDYELKNEYIKDEDIKEIIYSATPNVNSVLNIPLPSINTIEPDNNIRVLLNSGTASNYPFIFYDEVDKNTDLSNFIQVGYHLKTSMFSDNDVNPIFTICFDNPGFLFHDKFLSNTPNNMYNLHYKRTFSQLDNGKILTAFFDLNENDIQKLSRTFNYKIFIKDNGWFFLNKIIDYNATERGFTKVELITADDEIDINFIKNDIITKTVDPFVINDWRRKIKNINNTLINLPSAEIVDINGTGNIINSSGGFIWGNTNKVSFTRDNPFIIGNINILEGASSAFVLGDRNILKNRALVFGDGNSVSVKAFVIGDNLVVDKPGLYIDVENVEITTNEISLRTGYVDKGYIDDKYFLDKGITINDNGVVIDGLRSKVIEVDSDIKIDNIDVVLVDTTDDEITITLGDENDGVMYIIKDKVGNAYNKNIKVVGETGLIDGEPEYYIENDWEGIKVVYKNGNWFII